MSRTKASCIDDQVVSETSESELCSSNEGALFTMKEIAQILPFIEGQHNTVCEEETLVVNAKHGAESLDLRHQKSGSSVLGDAKRDIDIDNVDPSELRLDDMDQDVDPMDKDADPAPSSCSSSIDQASQGTSILVPCRIMSFGPLIQLGGGYRKKTMEALVTFESSKPRFCQGIVSGANFGEQPPKVLPGNLRCEHHHNLLNPRPP